MADDTTIVLTRGLLRGRLRFPNLDQAAGLGLGYRRFRESLLEDAGFQLQPDAQCRKFADDGAVWLARQILADLRAQRGLSEDALAALAAEVEAAARRWGATVDEELKKADEQLGEGRARLDAAAFAEARQDVAQARSAADQGRYDQAWVIAAGAAEQLRRKIEQHRHLEADQKLEADMLLEEVEQALVTAQPSLDPQLVTGRIEPLLRRGRELYEGASVDLEQVREICELARGLIAGRRVSEARLAAHLPAAAPAAPRPPVDAAPAAPPAGAAPPPAPEAPATSRPGADAPPKAPDLPSPQAQPPAPPAQAPRPAPAPQQPAWAASPVLQENRHHRPPADVAAALAALTPAECRARVAAILTPRDALPPNGAINGQNHLLERFGEAQRLYRAGDYEQAHAAFLAIHRAIPVGQKQTTARYNAIAARYALGDHQPVIDELEPVRGIIFGHPLWHLCGAYFHQGRLDDAIAAMLQWIASAEKQFNPTYSAFLAAALMLALRQEPEHAAALAGRAASDNAPALRQQLGLPESQEPAGSAVGEEYTRRTLRQLEHLLAPRPPDRYTQLFSVTTDLGTRAIIGQAIELVGDGAVEQAVKQLLEIERTARDVPRVPLDWTIGACLLLRDRGHDAEALDRLSAGEDTAQRPGNVLWNLAAGHLRQGNYASALHNIRLCATKEYQTSPKALLAYGLLSYLLGHEGEAATAIRRSAGFSENTRANARAVLENIADPRLRALLDEPIARGPAVTPPPLVTAPQVGEEQAAFTRAVAQARLVGSDQLRAQYFEQLARPSLGEVPEAGALPFDIVVIEALPRAVAGVVASTFDQATRAFRDRNFLSSADLFASVADGDRFVGLLNRGAALFRAERLGEAQAAFEDATREDDSEQVHHAHWNLAVTLYRRGEPRLALEALEQERRSAPDDALPLRNLHLAMLAEELRDENLRATALYEACRLLPEPSVALRCYTIKACRGVRDNSRVTALVKTILDGQRLPALLSGLASAQTSPEHYRTRARMNERFTKYARATNRGDWRGAQHFFQQVEYLREVEVARTLSPSSGQVEGLIYATLYHGIARSREGLQPEAAESYRKVLDLLEQHRMVLGLPRYAEVCEELAKAEPGRPHFVRRVARLGVEAARQHPEAANRLRSLQALLDRTIVDSSGFADEPLTPGRAASAADLADRPPPTLAEEAKALINQAFGGRRRRHSGRSRTGLSFSERAQEICRNIESFPRTPSSAQRALLGTMQDQLRYLRSQVLLELPDRGEALYARIVQLLQAATDTLARELPSIEVGPHHVRPVYYSSDETLELTCYVYVKNVGKRHLEDIELRLSFPKHRDQLQLSRPVQRIRSLGQDDQRWVEWNLTLNELPESEERELELQVQVTVLDPKSGANLYTQSVLLTRQLVRFDGVTVAYPAGALRPENVEQLWGRELLLRDMAGVITSGGQSPIFFLEGVRKVGKTSIMYFLADKLADDTAYVYVNFDTGWTNIYARIGQAFQEQLFVSREKAQLADLPPVSSAPELSALVSAVLAGTGMKRLLLLFDEFGTATGRLAAQPGGANFLGDMREILGRFVGRIAIVLADFRLLRELKEQLPGQMWADVNRRQVSFLDTASTTRAVRGPVRADDRITFSEEVVKRIYHYTGGYPWHIQLLCYGLMRHLDERRRYEVFLQDVDQQVDELLEQDSYFEEGLARPGRLSRADREVLAALARRATIEPAALDDDSDARWLAAEQVVLDLYQTSQLSEEEVRARIRYLGEIGVLIPERGEERQRVRFSSLMLARWCKKQALNGSLLKAPAQITQPAPLAAQPEIPAPQPEPIASPDELAAGLVYRGAPVTAGLIEQWLAQFGGPDERELALRLLGACRQRYYYDEPRLRALLGELFERAITTLMPIVGLAPDDPFAFGDFVNTHLRVLRRAPHSASEQAVIGLLARAGKGLGRQHIVESLGALYAQTAAGTGPVAALVVDEFVGTGTNLLGQLEGAAAELRAAVGEEAAAAWLERLHLGCVVAVEHAGGVERVREQLEGTLRLYPIVGDRLGEADGSFSEESSLWASPDQRKSARALAKQIGQRLSPLMPLGAGGAELLVVFAHMVPDSTLPLLHRAGAHKGLPWQPLFPQERPG